MAEAGLAPTLATFNNVLYSLSRYRRHPQAPKWAMQVINEMKAAGIGETLISRDLILHCFVGSYIISS